MRSPPPSPGVKIPMTRKLKIPRPVLVEDPAVGVSEYHVGSDAVLDDVVPFFGELGSGGVVDLTHPALNVWRLREKSWSLLVSSVAGDPGVVLSRQTKSDELERNNGRIDGFGMCGYLALEWASRSTRHVVGQGLSLRDPQSKAQLSRFLSSLVEAAVEPAASKVRRVVDHLAESLTPWHTAREDGLWLDIADLQYLNLSFPLVCWGVDQGDGWRRVAYPPLDNGLITVASAQAVVRVGPHIVLDADHFHPLDEIRVWPFGLWHRVGPDTHPPSRYGLGVPVPLFFPGERGVGAGAASAKRGAATLVSEVLYNAAEADCPVRRIEEAADCGISVQGATYRSPAHISAQHRSAQDQDREGSSDLLDDRLSHDLEPPD